MAAEGPMALGSGRGLSNSNANSKSNIKNRQQQPEGDGARAEATASTYERMQLADTRTTRATTATTETTITTRASANTWRQCWQLFPKDLRSLIELRISARDRDQRVNCIRQPVGGADTEAATETDTSPPDVVSSSAAAAATRAATPSSSSPPSTTSCPRARRHPASPQTSPSAPVAAASPTSSTTQLQPQLHLQLQPGSRTAPSPGEEATTAAAPKLQTPTVRSHSRLSEASAMSWLLPLLGLLALFGAGQAGFACLSNPCVFGVCIDGLNSSYSCYCIDGYTGIQCQTNWDECWSGPCQNGGSCVDGVAYYNCTCPDGFSGSNCEENVDECMSNPCQNGGQCKDRTNGYTCSCLPGYLGANCEQDVAVCETGTGARCHNGGECLEGPGLEFTCECPAGWQGRICQTEVNECESGPCQNGGVCVDKLAAYVCACPMGYTGTNCEEEILICADNPCQNNALCLMEEGVPTCYCVPDYHGEKCEFQYDECQLGPRCMNGGVCIDGVDTFSCSCPPLLTGMLCECLMIGEDSLDCNYTSPYTPASPASPATTPAAAPTTTTPATPAAEVGATTEARSVEGEVEGESSEVGKGQVDATTRRQGATDDDDDGGAGSTTEAASASVSYSAEGGASSQATFSAETSGSSEVVSAEHDYTTESRLDTGLGYGSGSSSSSSSSREITTTTARPTSSAVDTDYSPESAEQPASGFASTTTTTTFTHRVTTIQSVFSSTDFSTHRPTWVAPTRPPQPTVTTAYPSARETSTGTEYPEYGEPEAMTTTPRPWHVAGVSTTAAPFFTEYPEVYVTTGYRDFTSKDMSVGGTRPPPIGVATTSSTATDGDDGEDERVTTSTITIGGGTSRPHYTHTTPLPTSAPTRPHLQQVTTTGPEGEGETEVGGGSTTRSDWTTRPAPPDDDGIRPAAPTTTESWASPPRPPVSTEATGVLRQTTRGYGQAPTSPPPTQTHTSIGPATRRPVTTSSEEEQETRGGTGVGGGGGVRGGAGDNTTDADCLKMGCYNGGTCVTTSEGSRCVCRFDRQGALCEAPIVIKNAAFSGDSYVSHRLHKDIPNHESLDSVLPMHVQLKVRTRATNGLIMLAAAQGTKGGHYMALFLQKGLLQFQFSCGLQTMLLSELETPVNTGNEISIRAELDFSRNYTHCNASLLVNDTLAMSGDQPTWLKLLPPRLHTPDAILNTWLHLGGAPQAPIGLIIELPPAQSGTGFTGCLHSLRINEASREIFGDALDGFGITECGSLACLSSPCRNGAACIKIESNEVDENGDKTERWKCKCPTGYMGPTCETSVCEDNPCQYGGTCVQFPGSGYLCLCPLGKHGHYCEHNLEVALPSFSGSVNGLSSFVAYTVPIPLEYSLELSFKILPQTMSQISLLAFLGQSGYHDEKSDHLAVSFIQGYIMLTWNLGAGPRRIFTQKPIDFRLDAPRVPYEIRVGRIGRQAWLSVDGKFNITGRSPGSVSRMDVVPILYLGGHEIANFNTLPHDLPLHSGFQGCIYDVHLKAGQVSVPLQETRGVRGRGVGQCGTRECHRHACQHDGACLQHGATFTCICQEGWFGPLCAQPSNPCDSFNNKCSEEATCVPLVNGYECDCPVGKTGKNCDEDIRSLSDVSLTGRRSYLAVRWPYFYDNSDKLSSKRSQMVSYRNFTKKVMPPKPVSSPSQHFVMKLLNEVEKQRSFSPVPLMGSKSFEEHHRVQFFFVEFQLRPLSERGLLLYFGSLSSGQDKKAGFVSLSLQGGVVEFRISGPSQHVTVVRSVRMLAIGEWHKIKMAQRGRWLTLWVEGSASSALAPSAEVLVEPDSQLYIGGLKDLSKLPHNAISGFPIPFRGCVRGLVVSGTRIVLNETNILESRNIRDCDGTACGGDSCEAGGHCWLDEKLQPHCICPEYAKGDRCEYSETCKLIPCKNNGRCLRSGRCSCPNGWGGFYCEIATSKPTTPSFRGNSYLILPPPRIPVKDKRRGPSMYVRPREAVQVSLNFSTIEPDGLLLWSEHDRAAKFLGLGLENGHLKIASNLLGTNNDTVEAPSGGFLSDGAWHLATVLLDRGRLEMRLDGEVIFAEKLAAAGPGPTDTTTVAFRRGRDPSITYEDVFYLGGFPNSDSISARTQGRFAEPFKGCLQDIQFGAEQNSVITDFSAYQGENIGSCDLHGDEPIVV